MKNGVFSLILFFVFCNSAFCDYEPNAPEEALVQEPNAQQLSLKEQATKDLKALPHEVLKGSEETYFRADNLAALLIAGGASVVMHNEPSNRSFDDKIADHFQNHKLPSDLDEAGDITGSPGTHFAITGIWYGLAAANKDDLNRQRAFTMLTALSITGATTLTLKLAVNNHCPNGKPLAWPSGHTASSFTVASVLDEFYGPEVGYPAYAVAGFVGYRMMAAGDHWASDVLFGGVLGWVVGHTVAGKQKSLEVAGFEIVPAYLGDNPAAGVTLVRKF